MMKSNPPAVWMQRLTIFWGTSAIILGAFGAHALKSTLLAHQSLETWKTASFYHLTHALFLLFITWVTPEKKCSFIFINVGILLFSGSLYLLAIFQFSWLGPITPLGGLCFIAGWLALLLKTKTDQNS